MSIRFFSISSHKSRGGVARAFALILLCSCFYGFANFLSGKYYLPGCSFAELRPQIVLPMFIGILYGPVFGFIVGASGDMLGYVISGKGFFFAPLWSLANGFMGFIPGLLIFWHGRPVTSIYSFTKLLALLLIASSLPFFIPIGFEIGQGNMCFNDALYKLFLPIIITDTLWAFIFTPILMLFAGLLRIRIELRTILIIHYLLIFTILATWICNIIFTMQEEVPIEKLYMLGGITIFVLIIGLAVSAVFAKKITSPLTVLTTLAEQAAGGDYSNVKLLHRFLARNDEIGVLAKVFNNMIQAVEKRETAYKQEVSELRIKIDHKKQKEELNKIKGTNYFQNLKLKAGDLRRKASNKEEDQ